MRKIESDSRPNHTPWRCHKVHILMSLTKSTDLCELGLVLAMVWEKGETDHQ